MPGCSDTRFETLLFAYELGMLDEQQRMEMELHLMGCDSCFAQVEKLRHAAGLMREGNNIRRTAEQYCEEVRNQEVSRLVKIIQSRQSRKFIPIACVIILIGVIFITGTWNIEVAPDKKAIAGENRLMVLPFENLAEPDDLQNLSQIASSLLARDLSESEYIDVVPDQRINNILREKGIENEKPSAGVSVYDIAEEVNARYFLTGKILETVPRYVISYQISAVSSGEISASQRIIANPGEDIFTVIDKLADETKKVLNLPAAAYSEIDRKLSDVTTSSYQAYFYYIEGKNFMYRHLWTDAVQSFTKAVEYDSTFAMAYYYLARFLGNSGFLSKALEYSDRTTRLEKYYIESHKAVMNGDLLSAIEVLKKIVLQYTDEIDALLQLGFLFDALKEYDQAIEYYNEVLRIDPSNQITHNYISLSYGRKGDFEKAIEENRKYIEYAPDEANPYDSRGQILANYGLIDDAIDAYMKASAIDPGFIHAVKMLGNLYVFKGEYSKADSCYRLMISKGDKYFRSTAHLCRVYIPLHQGKLASALEMINGAIQSDSIEAYPDYNFSEYQYLLKLILKATILAESREYDSAISAYDLSKSSGSYDFPTSVILSDNICIDILLKSGQIRKAEEKADSLRIKLDNYSSIQEAYYLAKGQIEIAKGNYEEALVYFRKYEPFKYDFYSHHWRGRALLDCRQFNEAISEFKAALNSCSSLHLFLGTTYVKTYYYLGRAYEAKGLNEKAIKEYQKLVNIWQNSEYEFEELRDARRRLLELK